MKIRHVFLLMILIVLLVSSCAQVQEQQKPVENPDDAGTADVKPKVEEKPVEKEPEPTIKIVAPEIKELIDKSKTRVGSIYYRYEGPETADFAYEFYVKGSRIKYLPERNLKSLDSQDAFNAVYINKDEKTAQSYCDEPACKYKGKKADLDYDGYYIEAPFDWIEGLTYADKVGEEVIESRSTWKVSTNKGTLWLDNYYGIPLKVESDDGMHRFQQIAVGKVTDEDVTPKG